MKSNDEGLNWRNKVIQTKDKKKSNTNQKNKDQIGDEFFLNNTYK